MLTDLLTIDLQYNEYHIVFPKIIAGILVFLLVAMAIKNLIKRMKAGTLTKFNYRFFEQNYDKLKLFGTLALLIVYVAVMETIGFLVSSILFMVLLTILLRGDFKRNTIILSLINSVTTSAVVWFLFGYLFDITLP